MTERDDAAHLRISDADRHRVAEVLREAAGEGRLDLTELDERLEAAYTAKVYADLVPLLADLPGEHLPVVGSPAAVVPRPDGAVPVPAPRYDSSVAFFGNATRRGVWEVPQRHTAFAMWGGVKLDLRQARLTARETVVTVNAIWAGVDVVVNAHTHVIVDGVGIMGSFDQARDRVQAETGPDSPTVRVRGFALMAGVTVVRRPMPGEERRKRLPR